MLKDYLQFGTAQNIRLVTMDLLPSLFAIRMSDIASGSGIMARCEIKPSSGHSEFIDRYESVLDFKIIDDANQSIINHIQVHIFRNIDEIWVYYDSKETRNIFRETIREFAQRNTASFDEGVIYVEMRLLKIKNTLSNFDKIKELIAKLKVGYAD